MAVCTNKQEHLSVDLLKKIKIYHFFDYVAGGNTFNHNKPNPRHLTDTVEIIGGDVKKTIMVGDSETDSNASKAANIPFILLEDGYTDSSGSFSTLGGNVGYLEPYTVTLNEEETTAILSQNSQSISINSLETYLTSYPTGSTYIKGSVSG